MNYSEAMNRLWKLSNKDSLQGMSRFGINTVGALGVSIPELRNISRLVGTDQELSLRLWKSEIHEAMILASFVGDPAKVTEQQMEEWVNDFDSWDVCDQCCGSLFDRTRYAYQKAAEWPGRDKEFVKRAGFALMAALAVHDKSAGDKRFEAFLRIIKRESNDERNFVKKAVNWALRQIGKRNWRLKAKAISTAKQIQSMDSKAARWIAADALRELKSHKFKRRTRLIVAQAKGYKCS